MPAFVMLGYIFHYHAEWEKRLANDEFLYVVGHEAFT